MATYSALDSLDRNVFKGLAGLRSLVLIGFKDLRCIERHTLAALTNVESIDLSENGIEEIEPGSFSSLLRLDELYLVKNRLTKCPSLVELAHLHSLFLDDNAIESTDGLHSSGGGEQASVTSRLRILSLAQNKVEELEANAFAGLASLRSLNLSFNKIANMPSDAFCGLCNLQKLDLSGNKISCIVDGQFVDLVNLKLLDLAFLDLKRVDLGGFSEFLNRLMVRKNTLKDASLASALNKIENISLYLIRTDWD
jgi:Leucine-rich repeat (LRR) protein